MPERKERCETCRYWDAHPHSQSNPKYFRACVRFPPTIQGDDQRGVSLETHARHWCGEWQPQETQS